jgi:hypothetical protein
MGILKGEAGLGQNDFYPHGFRSKFHTARTVLGEMGPFPFLTKVLPWSFRRRYIFYSEKIRIPEANPHFPARFRFGIAGKEDLDSLMALRKGYYKKEMLERRLDMGQICFLGWSGKELVHIRWLFLGTFYVPYLRRKIVLGPDEVFGDEAYTAPDFRKACVTSNYQTDVIPALDAHPLPLWLAHGVRACVCTDNTLFSDVSATEEYRRAVALPGMPRDAVERLCAKSPGDRYPSAEALLVELHALLRTVTVAEGKRG